MSKNDEFIKIANEITEIAHELEEVMQKSASNHGHDYMHDVPQHEQNVEAYKELVEVDAKAEKEEIFPKWEDVPSQGDIKEPKKAGWADEKNMHDYMHDISAEEQNKHNAEELAHHQMGYQKAVEQSEKTYGDQSDNSTYYNLTKEASTKAKALLEEANNLIKVAKWLEKRGL